jgi:starch synthase
MKIAMVASEAKPLATTGGLGEVIYSLSKKLTIAGEEVCIIMPYYKMLHIDPEYSIRLIGTFDVYMSWRKQSAQLFRTYIEGITYYLIGNNYYFNRDNYYGYYDDNERYAFFTLATRNLFKYAKMKPDIIHLHDWHAGMLPALINEQNSDDPFFSHIKFILTIHNPAFQGLFDPFLLGDYYGLSEDMYNSGKVRLKGKVSSLKSAIMFSNKIVTVSPTHAQELLTEQAGHGINHVIAYCQDDFSGILNGIDYIKWNPETDNLINHNFSLNNYAIGKQQNKLALLQQLNLKDGDYPLFSIISRLTWQKGIDLIINNCLTIIKRGGSLIVLGVGEANYEQDFLKLMERYPRQIYVKIGYDEQFAHQIYAASDFFLMPSLFEPCGISQMISMRYGTIPIVRLIGGLKDTVSSFKNDNVENANGIGFEQYNNEEFRESLIQAYKVYGNQKIKHTLINNAMKSDNDWQRSADQYLSLYKKMINDD